MVIYYVIQYPTVCGTLGKVTSVVDLTVGYDSSTPDFRPVSIYIECCDYLDVHISVHLYIIYILFTSALGNTIYRSFYVFYILPPLHDSFLISF